MRTAENGTKLHDCSMVLSAARSAPIGLYTTSLLGVVQLTPLQPTCITNIKWFFVVVYNLTSWSTSLRWSGHGWTRCHWWGCYLGRRACSWGVRGVVCARCTEWLYTTPGHDCEIWHNTTQIISFCFFEYDLIHLTMKRKCCSFRNQGL